MKKRVVKPRETTITSLQDAYETLNKTEDFIKTYIDFGDFSLLDLNSVRLRRILCGWQLKKLQRAKIKIEKQIVKNNYKIAAKTEKAEEIIRMRQAAVEYAASETAEADRAVMHAQLADSFGNIPEFTPGAITKGIKEGKKLHIQIDHLENKTDYLKQKAESLVQ